MNNAPLCRANFFNNKWSEHEKELMKGVQDWEVNAASYKKAYMPPMEIKGTGPMVPRI